MAIVLLARDAPAVAGPVEDGVCQGTRPTGRKEANSEARRRAELQKLEAALAVLAGEDSGLWREERGALAEQDLAGRKGAAVGDQKRAKGHTCDGGNHDSDHSRSVGQLRALRKLGVVICIPTEKG